MTAWPWPGMTASTLPEVAPARRKREVVSRHVAAVHEWIGNGDDGERSRSEADLP